MPAIRAIARNTFIDAMRKKVWLVVVLFAALMILPAIVFPAPTEGIRVQMVLAWALWGMAFFGSIVAIFIAAPHLWHDIVDRTIYTVISKPVSRVELIVGRLLGYMSILLVITIGLALVGAVFALFAASSLQRKSGAEDPRILETDTPIEATTGVRLPEPDIASDDSLLARRQYHVLTGSGPQKVVFQFTDLEPEQFTSKNIRLKFRFAVADPTLQGRPETQVDFKIVNENKPEEALTRSLLVENHIEVYIPIERDYLRGVDTLTVTISRADPHYTVAIVKSRCHLLAKSEPFRLSFTKAAILSYASSVLLAVVALASSTILEGSVCILWSFFVYFMGSSMQVIRDTAEVLSPGRLTFIGILQNRLNTGTPFGKTIQGVNNLIRYFLNGMTEVLPDFSRFNTAPLLTENLSISRGFFYSGLLHALIFCLIAMIIAFIAFRNREVGFK